MITRTNADIKSLEQALQILGSPSSKSEKAKHTNYNAFMQRLHLVRELYRPVFQSVSQTEDAIVKRFVALAGDDVEYFPNGGIMFGEHTSAFIREQTEFLKLPAPEEPEVVPLTVEECSLGGVLISESVMEALGPVFKSPPLPKPAGDDDDDDA